MPSSECPPPSLLDDVASGRIQEPLLGIYLDHMKSCDACCAHVARHSDSNRSPVRIGGSDGDTPWTDSLPGQLALTRWLDELAYATQSATPADESRIGTMMGVFRIEGVLGTGASSVVFEATDVELGRPVVLKVLHRFHEDDRGQHAMIVREARALAALQHDAIMPLLQLIWHEGSPVLVFPRLPGETLADFLRSGDCPLPHLLTIARDTAHALAHAHSLGIFHYDVKPSNIWLWRRGASEPGLPLLFDFGLTGGAVGAVGTPGYRDPRAAERVDAESLDLFSFGVVLHECLVAAGSTHTALHGLVRRLTATHPKARPRAREAVVEIDRILARPQRLRRTLAASAVLAACVAAGVATGYYQFGLPHDTGVTASDQRLRPSLVIPDGPLPVAISQDARLLCRAGGGHLLTIHALDGKSPDSVFKLAFAPDRLEINADGTFLGATEAAGDVAVIAIASGELVASHHFPGGIASAGWSGWTRHKLVILSGTAAYALIQPYEPRKSDTPPLAWPVMPLREDVRELATLPQTEAAISMAADGTLTMWSVGGQTEDTALLTPSFTSGEQLTSRRFGWKNPGVWYYARGARLSEHAPHYGIRSYQILAPAQAIGWASESEYILLTDESGGSPRLLMGDRSRPAWSRTLDLAGEHVVRMQMLDESRQVAAFTSTGGIRIYRLRQ